MQVCTSTEVLKQWGSLLLSSGVFVQLSPLLQALWAPREHRSTLQSLRAVRLKWWGWCIYVLYGSLPSSGRSCITVFWILMNKKSHLSTGKLLVPIKVVRVPTPTYFIPTVQNDRLPYLTGYVWLVLSNFLGHTRSCGKKSENWAEVVNEIM